MRNWTEYYTAFTREADKHLRPSLRSLPFHTYLLAWTATKTGRHIRAKFSGVSMRNI